MEITNNIYVHKVSIYCMKQNSFKFLKILNFANNNNNNNEKKINFFRTYACSYDYCM